MKLVCFGDSNTWGFDPRSFLGDRYNDPWPSVLSKKLGCPVINLGENGQEIPRYPMRFPAETDLLIVMLGTNDLLRGRAPAAVCRSMGLFLKALGMELQKILLLSPPLMKLGAWVQDPALVSNSVELASAYHHLAQSFGIHFADTSSWNLDLAFDGVHLTAEAHRVFAENLYSLLKKENVI